MFPDSNLSFPVCMCNILYCAYVCKYFVDSIYVKVERERQIGSVKFLSSAGEFG